MTQEWKMGGGTREVGASAEGGFALSKSSRCA